MTVGSGVASGTVVAVGTGVEVSAGVGAGTASVGVDVAAGIGVLVAVEAETTGALVGSDSTVGVQANAADIATATNNNRRRPRGVRFAGLSITTSEATRFRLPSHWEFRTTIWFNVGISNKVSIACAAHPTQITTRTRPVGVTLRDR